MAMSHSTLIDMHGAEVLRAKTDILEACPRQELQAVESNPTQQCESADAHGTQECHQVAGEAACCWPLNDSRLRWYAYARVAWWHLLRSLGGQRGDNVVLPDLICDVMTEPLQRLGIQARYYRGEPLGKVDPDAIDRLLDARTRAVLAVHYFGLPTDVRAVAAYCMDRGLPLVEDASQSLFSRDDARPIGRQGSAVLFSFRKTLRLPHGAGLLCRDGVLADALDGSRAELAPPRRDVWRYWAKRVDRKWLGGSVEQVLDAIRSRRRADRDDSENAASTADPFDTCLVIPSRTARWLTLSANVDMEIRRRRTAFEALAQRWACEGLPGRPLVASLDAGWVPYAFVVEPDADGADVLAARLREEGVTAEPWPKLPHDAPADTARRRKVLCLL